MAKRRKPKVLGHKDTKSFMHIHKHDIGVGIAAGVVIGLTLVKYVL